MHHLRENVRIAPYTTIKVGGPARYFFEVTTDEELFRALGYAQENNFPAIVLGGGSNILFPDEGFAGVVIKMSTKNIREEDLGGSVRVVVDAGVSWDDLVTRVTDGGLWGIENLAGIPGTVGGAIVQNIGAYGGELQSAIEWVEVFDMLSKERRVIAKNECAFGYRESLWKLPEGKALVVLRGAFTLAKNPSLNIGYKDIPRYFAERHIVPKTSADVRDAVRAIRRSKLPALNNIGTAGSFFKNPVVSREKADELLHQYPDMPLFIEQDGRTKLSAGWLIEHIAKKKGKRYGDVGSWGKQALVLVNYGNAKAKEIKLFADEIAESVRRATGVVLEAEVVVIQNPNEDPQ